MADVGFRDLIGSLAPSRRTEPTVAPPVRDAPLAIDREPQSAMVTPPSPPPLFGRTMPVVDDPALDAIYDRLTELALHRRTGTPLILGVGGAPGTGKSVALARIVERAEALAHGAAGHVGTPFVSRLHVVTIDAATLAGEPMLALAARMHASLQASYPEFARELGHLARDPHAALRDCNDKLDEVRRRLDGERRALDDAGSRRARLVETVLYETSGSAVDAYARANRAGLERRFGGFGVGGDALRNYKDFVLNAAAPGGRLSLTLRAVWAFKGQVKLLGGAVLLAALGVGLGIAIDTRDVWLGDLRGGPQAGVGLANWLEAHVGLLATARTAAFAIAVACIAANLWRAFAFCRPILRGTAMLGGDLEGRRRDLDGLYAHGTKRVDALDADVERLTREVGAAERRAAGRAEPSPFEGEKAGDAAALFAALTAATRREPGKDAAAPERVFLVLDGLDHVAPGPARAILLALRRGLGEGSIALVAFDVTRSDAVAAIDLDHCVDLPVTLPPLDAPDALVADMLGLGGARVAPRALDAGTSSLDAPLADGEADLLAVVAPLAGTTPRSVRRFVDLYRLARVGGDIPRGALALALALRLNGTDEERDMVARASVRGSTAFTLAPEASGRLASAWHAAARFDGEAFGDEAVAAAKRQARFYGFPA